MSNDFFFYIHFDMMIVQVFNVRTRKIDFRIEFSRSKYTRMEIFLINPLVPEFCFPLIFEIYPKSGSYRPPTHRRDAHRKFF